MVRPENYVWYRHVSTTLSLILAGGSAGAWCVLRIMFGIDDSLSLILAGGSAGAWCVLRIMFGIDDSLADFGGWQRWRVVRPENHVWYERLSRLFPALARGAS